MERIVVRGVFLNATCFSRASPLTDQERLWKGGSYDDREIERGVRGGKEKCTGFVESVQKSVEKSESLGDSC